MLRKSVAVAMSGGVDSAVAALLLKNAGHHVHGIFMRTWAAEDDRKPLTECPWAQDLDDARTVCQQLDISFEIVNMIANYRQLVVRALVDGYRNGITPNPDVLCNMRIKFGILRAHAKNNGFGHFATGHYCRTMTCSDGTIDLIEAADNNKDQSYFLSMLSQEQVKNLVFPVGNMNKQEVRKIAEQNGLCNYKKKDSQGICFLGRVKIQDFLSHYIPNSPGAIIDVDGNVIGQHSGLFRFTIGQRHGMNLSSNRDNQHYVVVGKDLEKNHLIVEIERNDSTLLYRREFLIKNLSCINKPFESYGSLRGRARYRDQVVPIEFSRIDARHANVVFSVPQRAVASGQIIAFYSGTTLVGGGIFT